MAKSNFIVVLSIVEQFEGSGSDRSRIVDEVEIGDPCKTEHDARERKAQIFDLLQIDPDDDE